MTDLTRHWLNAIRGNFNYVTGCLPADAHQFVRKEVEMGLKHCDDLERCLPPLPTVEPVPAQQGVDGDLLNMERLNSLPHPLYVAHIGAWWPVHDIDVQTGLIRIDVSGKLDVLHFGGITGLRDANGAEHNLDSFYIEHSTEDGAAPSVAPFIDIVFDGPPGPVSGHFVEVENDKGASISVGEWVHRPDGFWALRIHANRLAPSPAPAPQAQGERTPKDYAIEHAGYMAKNAEALIVAVNTYFDLVATYNDDDLPDDKEAPTLEAIDAQASVIAEAQSAVSLGIYEFRKRRDRALQGDKG